MLERLRRINNTLLKLHPTPQRLPPLLTINLHPLRTHLIPLRVSLAWRALLYPVPRVWERFPQNIRNSLRMAFDCVRDVALPVGFGGVLDGVQCEAGYVADVDVVVEKGGVCGELGAGENGPDVAVCAADLVDGFGRD